MRKYLINERENFGVQHPATSLNFKCPVYGAEEEDYDEIPTEVSQFLEREKSAIQAI